MSLQCPEKLHISNLKHMGLSPAHFDYFSKNGLEETDEMRKGTAMHSMVLGGKPVVIYDGVRKGDGWKAFKAKHDGEIILKPDAFADAANMAGAIKAHPEAARLLEGTQREVHIDWVRGGVPCCSTLDAWHVGGQRIVDLKSTRTAKPEYFQRIAFRLGYHAQMSWYLEAAAWKCTHRAVLGQAPNPPTPSAAYIIAVESKPPYPVVVWEVKPSALEEGRKCCVAWFERMNVCRAAGYWPGYTDAILPLEWADEEPELVFDDSDS